MNFYPQLVLSVTASLVLVAGVVPPASASPALAQQKNCMACHAAAARVVGPSYKEIAVRYAGQADASAQLAERIARGSTGRWGFVPMPPNAQVSPDEARTLADWILGQP